MIKKEKIFELKIEEDDEISGIDSISLVDEPAIEINWFAFNKECKDGCGVENHDFHIPDGEDHIYIEKLSKYAQDERELFNEGWVVDSVEILDKKLGFISTNPNGPSMEDESEYNVRYKYILNPRITGQGAVIPTTRDFCKDLINKNYVWRVEDMEKVQNDFGQSALVWRGGYNCRHVWSRIKYRKDATIINKASVNKGKVMEGGFPNDITPDPRVLGYSEPSTVTTKTLNNPSPSTIKNLGLSKEKFAKISIDYDDTLSTERGKELAKQLLKDGNELVVVTRRYDDEMDEVKKTASDLGIDKVYNTNGQLKWKKLKELGIEKHIDNNPDEINAIKDNAPEIEAEKFGYDVSTLPPYKNELPTGKTENFESYDDYPEAAKNNAKRALSWAEKNGWGSCGTAVGKQRANQLANGEKISEETISRMASFERHRQHKDVPYEEGCGGLMWDAWGGTEGIEWAQRKLDQLNKENMSKQVFQIENEEKKIVIGPAMVPNQKIIRQDKITGEPYYVFFSPDTIKMIAEKYMRNKYIDNNDTQHDGKAVKDVYVIESWIKEDEQDKSNKYGFGNLPVGTWFVAMKVRNEDVWKRIKSKELNGFSVSGYFEEVAQFSREEMFLFQLAEILKSQK